MLEPEEIKNSAKKTLISINKEGYFIILITFIITVLVCSISSFLGWIFFILFFFIVYFFRDPERIIPDEPNIVVASADGIVDKIEEVEFSDDLELKEKKFQRVSIFLNVFNVHTQRIPISGEITKIKYIAGKFMNITYDKYHKDNERNICVMKTNNNKTIIFVQIAGMIAKRIICKLQEGQKVNIGERFGCIKFGSRVDVYLPLDAKLKVKVGQTMIAGESIIATL